MGGSRFAVLLVWALLRPALGAGEPDSPARTLTWCAAHAAVVVVGEVQEVAATTDAVGAAADAPVVVARVQVVRAVIGSSPPTLRVQVARADAAVFQPGQRLVLFLERPAAPTAPGLGDCYRLLPLGAGPAAALRVAAGVVDIPGGLADPAYATLLPPPVTDGQLAEVLLIMRGPVLAVRVVEAAPRCDRPLHLEISLTNPSALPMPLRVEDPRPESREGLHLCAIDGDGFPLSAYPLYLPDQDGAPAPSTADAVQVMAPGATLLRRVGVAFDADDFRIDPARARSLWLRFMARSQGADIAGGWAGEVVARAPLTLACPFPAWAAGLAVPAPTLLPVIVPRNQGPSSWRRAPELEVMLHTPADPAAEFMADPDDEERAFSDAEREAMLDACLVERDGALVHAAVQGPVLARLVRDIATRAVPPVRAVLDLATRFDCSAPGTWRIRLVLDQDRTPCRSNVLTVTVPVAVRGDGAAR